MTTTPSNPKAARVPRGFVDRTADEIRAAEAMMRTIRETYELYGFEPVETPLVEYTDALGKFLPDQDRPNEGVFSFQDDDEQWLSLRYDLTAPLARYVAENFERLAKPYRSYRAGWVFRNEKPGPGRFRQFMQFDADTVGAPSVAADAEMCMMMADTLEALGIARGQYVIRVNNRKVLDGVMEAIGLAGEENADKRLTVLRAIDKLDKIGPDGVRDLLGAGRWENPDDKSGDYTKGAGLDAAAADTVLAFVAAGAESAAATIANLAALVASGGRGSEGAGELATIGELIDAAGYGDRVRIDPSVVRGLEYYTGPVYEAELLFDVTNDEGQTVRFGSVGGGGRYDGLVGRFMKENVPATGFSIGVSRLAAALKSLGKIGGEASRGPVVVLVMDRSAIASYQAMVAELRAAGIRAEMYLGSSGMKPQMKYADRRNAPLAIIEGSNEREAGEVQIKDLDLGKELSKGIADNETWRASRPAQVTVKRADLVAEVQRMLAAAVPPASE
ncbi:histidine--tRNA ligase [Methylobrevis pamukkalensis]|uniref:Histidine--tRNA ligase n=1 Tax=Methylobrevis pamukkalensis TaxID=1439726 RepID=A0A1E3H5X3_9HYPH|nr:histidine--tRNA ligase [Methylobrevis pamukkalensis]ODN71717.1 Histidine--tRNA ligase [Methylobrevis pamukkalensis]